MNACRLFAQLAHRRFRHGALQVTKLLDQTTNSLAVLSAFTHVPLRVGNVQLALQSVHLSGNVVAVGNACGLANTLLTKQFALLDRLTGHGGLTLNKRDVRFSHAFLAGNVQHILVFQELRHWVYKLFAGLLCLQFCLTRCQLFFAHCFELLGQAVANHVALAVGQTGQWCARLNNQRGLIGVLQQILYVLLARRLIALVLRNLDALGGICGRYSRGAGLLRCVCFAALFAWNKDLLLVVAFQIGFRKLGGFGANRLRLLQRIFFRGQACYTRLFNRFVVNTALLKLVYFYTKFGTGSSIVFELLLDVFIERFVFGFGG